MENQIEKIFDENNTENIVLFNENNEQIEFEQIAVVFINEDAYVILKPIVDMPEIAEDEALVFCIEETDDGEYLAIVEDNEIVDKVFEEYYNILRKHGVDIE